MAENKETAILNHEELLVLMVSRSRDVMGKHVGGDDVAKEKVIIQHNNNSQVFPG